MTFKNYLRAIAQVSLHFKALPLNLTDNQINTYLTLHKTGQLDRLKPSEAYFKHAVFGLRYMFRVYGISDRHVIMPNMKRKKPIRDIMNRYEVIQLLKHASLMSHKIAFALAYGSGLRISELVNIQIRDVDLIQKHWTTVKGLGLNTHQLRHLNNISKCHTSALGGLSMRCKKCDH